MSTPGESIDLVHTEQLLQEFKRQLIIEQQACPPSAVSKKLSKVCTSWKMKYHLRPAVLTVLLIVVPSILIYMNEQASLSVMKHLRVATAATILPIADWLGLPDELCLIGNPMHTPPFVLKSPDDCRNCASLDRVIRIREGPFRSADFVRDLINTQQPAIIDPEAAGSTPLFSAGPSIAQVAQLHTFYSQLPPLEPQLSDVAPQSAKEAASAALLISAAVEGVCDMRHSLARSRPSLNSPTRLLRAAATEGLGSGPGTGWAASWRNCHPEVVRKFRLYLGRPECLPLSVSFGHSHLLMWQSHPGHEFMTLPTRPEHTLLLLHQVTGTIRIELTPREACSGRCAPLQAVLRPGQLLAVSNWYYRLAWLPVTMGEGFAVGLEASTVNF
ncbi:hypothetical protein BOX15_Mlig034593g2 [Macrostomum lignano]|uniref:Cupin_8 domain-containing protein n=1 Tax=Macrostomum lignano TaxID=282301 RepID=A0A267EFN9_9PLAT|nr:hypothetical protein BOX15_Mlig034593g2 [Macrostomum lignano]